LIPGQGRGSSTNGNWKKQVYIRNVITKLNFNINKNVVLISYIPAFGSTLPDCLNRPKARYLYPELFTSFTETVLKITCNGPSPLFEYCGDNFSREVTLGKKSRCQFHQCFTCAFLVQKSLSSFFLLTF